MVWGRNVPDSFHRFTFTFDFVGTMATSLSRIENELNCAICHQLYTQPRKLSGCTHCFCESCIVNFILGLKKEEKLGNKFGCPVCKLPNNSPGSDESVHRWVTNLEMDEALEMECKADIKPEGGDTDNYCNHCFSQEKFVVANKYCFSCNENYCAPCSENVHSFNVNKGHLVMDKGATGEKPEDHFHEPAMEMLNGFTLCSKHPKEAVKFYCEDDKIFCCLVCSIENHKQCTNLKPISLLSKESTTLGLTQLVDLTEKLTKHVDDRIGAIKANNAGNKRKAEQLDSEFQETKKKVIDLLDVLETNLRDERNAAVKNAALKNQDEIDDLEGLKRKLKMIHHLLENIVKNTSGDLAFVYIHVLTQLAENIEKGVIAKGNGVATNGLEVNETETFKRIRNLGPNETRELVSISMPDTMIAQPEYEERPFLRKFEVKKTGTHNILPARYPDGLPLTPTYGCLLFLPDKQMLLVDSFYGYCCLVNEEYLATKKWDMDDEVHHSVASNNAFSNERCATYLGENIIAVGVASHKTIIFLTCDGNFTEKVKLKCEYAPTALYALANGDVAVVWDEPIAFGIISSQIWRCHGKVLQCDGGVSYCEKVYFVEDGAGRKLKSFPSMAVDEKRGHVIQPCNVDAAVYCFDMGGNPVFCYNNDELKDPFGVAIDNDGNIFIVEYIESSIITIVKEGCPQGPLTIEYEKTKNEFAVTVYDTERCDEVHFFSVVLK